MDNIRGLLGIRMDSLKCKDKGVVGVTKGVDEGVFRWFGYVEKMENDRIVNRVYVGVCW